ncbi:hypothetical protein [Thermocoleostomius sinensis]|uniref:Uncharacterized protein n=1 Tax=Thermocoleostomius sinensis A174 TaxID=2016057 RepID=A0A9E8ZAL1_9CYAN|nr:hypothetical protein [Thermocoleostomius sinensis]WAL58347.1 hypothetical protein OXH18_14250 [Thermocoleostomius sinensis A174]
MKQFAVIGLAIVAAMIGVSAERTIAQTAAPAIELESPNADVPHLGVDGVFTLDTSVPSSLHDPRNPARVEFYQMEQFSFYRDLQGEEPIAENCQYTYRGAAPDPFYYPQFQTSIWDLFELTSTDPACSGFQYVILRSPHGEPIHMHMRYGGEGTDFESLLNMSTGEADTTRLDPWWSLYCAEGVTACDV